MLNFRREHRKKGIELRENPRIEFHFPATIVGVDAEACVVDFSLGGFYIESRSPRMIKAGQKVNIALKLPSENSAITVKAQVVYLEKKGFGCRLIDPTDETMQVLERSFTIFSGTLPADISSDHGCPNIVAA